MADRVIQVSRSRPSDPGAKNVLGELGDGREEVGDVVDEALGVGGFVVDDGVDGHDHVVGGDDFLRRDVDDLLTHVDQLHRFDEGHDEVETRLAGGFVFAETLDQTALVRAHDFDRADEHGDADQRDDADDDGNRIHEGSPWGGFELGCCSGGPLGGALVGG